MFFENRQYIKLMYGIEYLRKAIPSNDFNVDILID